MSATSEPQIVFGIEIAPEQRTPLVELLLRVIAEQHQEIEQLEAEIHRLQGLPEKPKRRASPSGLNEPDAPPSEADRKEKTRRQGKRPGSAKRSKTRELTIHETVTIPIEDLPEGSRHLGYEDFTVQDLRVEPHNTRYRRARYVLADGTFRTAALPEHVTSHFGATLQQFVLHQHFHNHVTQPLLHEEMLEMGVDISAGQINRLLTEGHDLFHQEKDSLLSAAREVSSHLHTDDTSARHCGQAGHTLHIGNDLFASFFTTDSKSRVNFLRTLLTPFTDYVLNDDAMFYLKYFDVSQRLRSKLQADADAWRIFEGEDAWQRQLEDWRVSSTEQRRLLTEAALWASLLSHDLYLNLTWISDDAAQFKVLAFDHALCWIHVERHVTRLIPLNDAERSAHARTRDAIWQYYQRLKAYRQSPGSRRRGRLQADFDQLFLSDTGWTELDAALRTIHGKRESLLVVLEHPEVPQHNNLSENDIRQYVKKRKISAGTRSAAGRRCRDTFLSLKTTCRKLGITFWRYLQDRIRNLQAIPPLAQLIRQKAAMT